MDKIGPMLGSLQVEAYALNGGAGWTGRGLVWRRRAGQGDDELMASVTTGLATSGHLACAHAYDQAHAEALRILLRQFACY